MELEEIQKGIGDYPKLVDAIKKTKGNFDFAKIRDEYDPMQHKVVTDKANYKDRTVKTPTGETTKPVARIPIPWQRIITSYAVTFLAGNPIERIANAEKPVEKDMVALIDKIWDDNKLDYKTKQIAKLMKSETECAEMWSFDELASDDPYWVGTPMEGAPKQRLKPRFSVFANSKGDSLYPVENRVGDMVAFCRGYQRTISDKKINFFDIYTADKIYYGSDESGKLAVISSVTNEVKKIPIMYYFQKETEWYSVQPAIERHEMSQSKHANQNDYFGAPYLVSTGPIENMVDKDDDGKVFVLGKGGDLKVVAWTQAPESIRLEQQNLIKTITLGTFTPNPFDEEEKAGPESGYAIKLKYLRSHMKASEGEETFGEIIQRRINFLKAVLIYMNPVLQEAGNLSIKPKFKYYLPKDEAAELTMLTNAISGDKPLMTQEAAVRQNPLLEDGAAEWEKLKAEKEEADSDPNKLDDEMNNRTPVRAIK